MYIEYQGYWTHGEGLGPYDLNNEKHQKRLNLWNQKLNEGHKQYKSAINTWTIRDPLKRETAKKNNLNWLEFFTIEEFMKWYNKLPENK